MLHCTVTCAVTCATGSSLISDISESGICAATEGRHLSKWGIAQLWSLMHADAISLKTWLIAAGVLWLDGRRWQRLH